MNTGMLYLRVLLRSLIVLPHYMYMCMMLRGTKKATRVHPLNITKVIVMSSKLTIKLSPKCIMILQTKTIININNILFKTTNFNFMTYNRKVNEVILATQSPMKSNFSSYRLVLI